MKKLIALGLLLTLTLTSCLPGLEYSIDLGKKGRSNGSVESNSSKVMSTDITANAGYHLDSSQLNFLNRERISYVLLK